MLSTKAVGKYAAPRKYDFITALGSHALAGDKHQQRQVLRLITLVTARYNWQREELAVGQREIARLWSVDERTVKREMARLRAIGWLVVKRQGARGRVTEYRLDMEAVLQATRPQWACVGSDFELRMAAPDTEQDKVVPLPSRGQVPAPDMSEGTEWQFAQGLLHAEDPALYGSWFRRLKRQDRAGGRLILTAPSRFHGTYVQTHLMARILNACRAVDDGIDEVVIAL